MTQVDIRTHGHWKSAECWREELAYVLTQMENFAGTEPDGPPILHHYEDAQGMRVFIMWRFK